MPPTCAGCVFATRNEVANCRELSARKFNLCIRFGFSAKSGFTFSPGFGIELAFHRGNQVALQPPDNPHQSREMIFRLRYFQAVRCCLFAFLAGIWGSGYLMAAEPRSASTHWHCSASDNFLTYTTDATLGQHLAKHCEAQRKHLAKQWLGDGAAAWGKCRCIVVVHPTARAYAAAVGRGGEQSTGCSTVRFNYGKLIYRRIDLRADRGDPLTAALPHELTHMVLADKFLDRPLPRWADEGMAILADPVHKQQGHQRDAQLATIGIVRFSARELLQMVDYPPATRQAAFYGQSAALVKFLVARGGHKKFLDFVDRSMTDGSDQALRATYQIGNSAELEQLWRRHTIETLVARE
jgi:hypothetical protein